MSDASASDTRVKSCGCRENRRRDPDYRPSGLEQAVDIDAVPSGQSTGESSLRCSSPGYYSMRVIEASTCCYERVFCLLESLDNGELCRRVALEPSE